MDVTLERCVRKSPRQGPVQKCVDLKQIVLYLENQASHEFAVIYFFVQYDPTRVGSGFGLFTQDILVHHEILV